MMKKYQNTLVVVIVAVIFFGGLILLSNQNSSSKNGGATATITDGVNTLVSEEKSFDFGTISMAAGNVKHSFKIKNTGSAPVAIEKVYTSCMCTNAIIVKGDSRKGPFGMPGHGFAPKINEAIGVGEEVEVEVIFDPTAHGPAGVGKIERVVYVESDSSSPLELQISANVTP